jgi:hypothetical protein
MKSNDNIPEDEMLLAEALSATRSRGLRFTTGGPFVEISEVGGERNVPWSANAIACCVLGALEIAGRVRDATKLDTRRLANAYLGNDQGYVWTTTGRDQGESLGWAFRCAMSQEDS